MTNPDDDFSSLAGGTGFMDRDLKAAIQGKPMPPADESETERRVRWSTAATEAYTGLYQLYEELRESGHAYAWSTAYEAAGMAGMLLADLRDLLNERTVPPTQPPTQEAPAAPCRMTQHCAAWGWCNRCDPQAGAVARHVVKAVDAMGVPPARAGSTYAAIMDLLRVPPGPRLPVLNVPADPPDELPEVRCNHAMLRQPHIPHTWEAQPGSPRAACPGYPPKEV